MLNSWLGKDKRIPVSWQIVIPMGHNAHQLKRFEDHVKGKDVCFFKKRRLGWSEEWTTLINPPLPVWLGGWILKKNQPVLFCEFFADVQCWFELTVCLCQCMVRAWFWERSASDVAHTTCPLFKTASTVARRDCRRRSSPVFTCDKKRVNFGDHSG